MPLSGARCPGQSGEEFSDSDSDLGLLGDAASDASFEGFPDPQTCPEAQLSARRIHLLSAAASAPVASAAGGDVFSGFHCARGSSSDALPSAPVGQLVRGQHHRFGLLEEPGGHSLIPPQFCASSDRAPLRGSLDSLGSSVHSRSHECSGGLPQSSVAGPRFGMDPVISSLPGSSSPVACDDRPLRDCSQPSSSSLLLADGRSSVGGHGFDDAAMGRPSGLCLPSFWPSTSRHREGPAVSGVGAHVGGSVLASAPLVSGASGGRPSVPSTLEGSTQTAALTSLPPEPPCASSDCVLYIERSACTFSFSSAVARQLTRCRRSSTRVNYQAKWAVYRVWCARHSHSVSRPTVPKVASFLLFLRRSLALSYSSIASYRSMLSVVVSCFLSSFPTLSFATFSILSGWSVLSSCLVSLLGIFLSFSLFCGVLPLSRFPLALCVTLPARSSSCCLLLLLIVWGNFMLCPHGSPLLVITCFCPIYRSFGRSLSLPFALCLALFLYVPFVTLWVLFLMSFSCARSALFAFIFLVLLLFPLFLIRSLFFLVRLLAVFLKMLCPFSFVRSFLRLILIRVVLFLLLLLLLPLLPLPLILVLLFERMGFVGSRPPGLFIAMLLCLLFLRRLLGLLLLSFPRFIFLMSSSPRLVVLVWVRWWQLVLWFRFTLF